MPQVFKVGSYWVYFWSNESEPLEPIHVHIAEGSLKQMGQKYGLRCVGNVCLQMTIPIYQKKL